LKKEDKFDDRSSKFVISRNQKTSWIITP